MTDRHKALEWFKFLRGYMKRSEYEGYLDLAISTLEKQEKIIEFIESRKQLHSSPAWYEFGIVKELDEVKRYVEKMQAEEEV